MPNCQWPIAEATFTELGIYDYLFKEIVFLYRLRDKYMSIKRTKLICSTVCERNIFVFTEGNGVVGVVMQMIIYIYP